MQYAKDWHIGKTFICSNTSFSFCRKLDLPHFSDFQRGFDEKNFKVLRTLVQGMIFKLKGKNITSKENSSWKYIFPVIIHCH